MADAPTTAAGCGCCQADPRSAQELVSDLQERRESLDRRLAELVEAK